MKKGLINEAFRLQQLAGIAPINEIGMDNSSDERTITVKKDIYYIDKLDRMTSLDNIDSKFHRMGELVFNAGDKVNPDSEEYNMILNSPSLELGDDYSFGNIMDEPVTGLQKEYIQSHEESITEAFQKAGIDLNKPVVYIFDYGYPSGTDEPKKVLGRVLLQALEDERAEAEAENPDFNETEGVQYEYSPDQGVGELAGDEEEITQGLTCKLLVFFSDSRLCEIWQDDNSMEETAEGLQKEQGGRTNQIGNTKTYYVVNRYGVTEIVPYKSLGFDGSEQWEELSGFDSDIIKKYYTDNDGTGKVVVDANTSEEEMLADLERIDDDLWM